MGTNLIGELVANNGTYFLSGSAAIYSGNIDQIIVRGTGVVLGVIYMTIDGEQTNVVEYYSTTSNLPDGLRITPQNNGVFTAVSLGGGSQSGVGLELVLA